MKKIIFLFLLAGFSANAQTATELLGKWQLVKWIEHGKEKDMVSYFKTDQVFQVFSEKNVFQSLIGEEVHKGKWKLSKDNAELTINSGIIPVKFKIDYFDAEKRVISSDIMGTLTYKKIKE